MSKGRQLMEAALQLSRGVSQLSFAAPVAVVYNPLQYAWESHAQYLERYGDCGEGGGIKALFLGMNPGPWGMAQNGVPFGEVEMVTHWLNIDAPVGTPARLHPKRPVEGLRCKRSEVSGRRLWGLFRERFGQPERFFEEHFVGNYCPLVFMEASARNRTPDKLPAQEREALFALCDAHLKKMTDILKPQWVIGVGRFALMRIQSVLSSNAGAVKIGTIIHPSPASPAANKDWAGTATAQMMNMGIWK